VEKIKRKARRRHFQPSSRPDPLGGVDSLENAILVIEKSYFLRRHQITYAAVLAVDPKIDQSRSAKPADGWSPEINEAWRAALLASESHYEACKNMRGQSEALKNALPEERDRLMVGAVTSVSNSEAAYKNALAKLSSAISGKLTALIRSGLSVGDAVNTVINHAGNQADWVRNRVHDLLGTPERPERIADVLAAALNEAAYMDLKLQPRKLEEWQEVLTRF
jgi:hypothetical protein